MNKMEISQEGLALIKKFEGCKLESYQCASDRDWETARFSFLSKSAI